MKTSVKKLVESFYGFDSLQDHDIRVEAAIASVAPRILSGNLRQRIREKADSKKIYASEEVLKRNVFSDSNAILACAFLAERSRRR